jgi:sugar-specific transcriptional regulator TrmB
MIEYNRSLSIYSEYSLFTFQKQCALYLRMNSLQKSLLQLGLNLVEVKIYFDLLEKRSENITKLALKLGISRKTLYQNLNEMLNKGVVTKQSTNWIATSPNVILSLLEIQASNLAKTQLNLHNDIENWEFMWKTGKVKSGITIHKGRLNFQRIYDGVLKNADQDLLTFGDIKGVFALLGEDYSKNWISRRKLNVKGKVISSDNSFNRNIKETDKLENREIQLVENIHNSNAIFGIYSKDRMLILNPTKEEIIEINDEEVVNLFKNMFYLIWEE